MRGALRHTHGSWPSSAGITTPALSSGFYGAVCCGGDSAPRLRLGPGRGGSRSRCRGWWAKAADPDVAAAGAKAAALRAVAAGAKARAHAADGAQAASLGGCCRCGASSFGLWGPIGFLPKSRSVGDQTDRPAFSLRAALAEMSGLARVGFVGLGKIGSAMASNMLKAGLCGPTSHFDLDAHAVARLAEKGSSPAASAEEVAAQSDILFSVLPNDQILSSVVFGTGGTGGINSSLRKGAVHVSCSTVGPW